MTGIKQGIPIWRMTWEMTEIIGGEYVQLEGNTHYYNYSCNDNYVLARLKGHSQLMHNGSEKLCFRKRKSVYQTLKLKCLTWRMRRSFASMFLGSIKVKHELPFELGKWYNFGVWGGFYRRAVDSATPSSVHISVKSSWNFRRKTQINSR